MKSLNQIMLENQEAAAQAARDNREPFCPFGPEEFEHWPPFPFPYFGDYVPHGWKRVKDYFVDASGFGQLGELALTAQEFLNEARGDYTLATICGQKVGWAVVEVGQFQVYVSLFRKLGGDPDHPLTKLWLASKTDAEEA